MSQTKTPVVDVKREKIEKEGIVINYNPGAKPIKAQPGEIIVQGHGLPGDGPDIGTVVRDLKAAGVRTGDQVTEAVCYAGAASVAPGGKIIQPHAQQLADAFKGIVVRGIRAKVSHPNGGALESVKAVINRNVQSPAWLSFRAGEYKGIAEILPQN